MGEDFVEQLALRHLIACGTEGIRSTVVLQSKRAGSQSANIAKFFRSLPRVERTQIAPSAKMAKLAATQRIPFSASSAHRSPGFTPALRMCSRAVETNASKSLPSRNWPARLQLLQNSDGTHTSRRENRSEAIRRHGFGGRSRRHP